MEVLLCHARGTAFVQFGALPAVQKSLPVGAVFALARIGNEAVIVFFVLSGFLVGGRGAVRIANRSFRPLDYSIDRFTRIMLPLVPALICTALVGLFLGFGFNLRYFMGNLFSLQGIMVPSFGGNAPLWSLAYEVWFYVLAGAIGVAVLNRRFRPATWSLIVLVCAIFTKLSSVYLFCWLIGALAYLQRPKHASAGALLAAAMMSVYGVIAVEVGSQTISLHTAYLRNFIPAPDASRILLAAGIAILFQHLVMIAPKRSFAVWVDATGTKLAAFSYSLYLTHYPLLALMQHLGVRRAPSINTESILTYFLVVGACTLFGWAMYWLFERRISQVRAAIRSLIGQWQMVIAGAGGGEA